jgi:aryl-alcohol dehydrogenase-like predicted oxidoreductase
MRAEGKIRHVGLSNVTLEQLAQAQGIVPIVTVQNRYNLSGRASERMTAAQSEEMIDLCARQGIGFIPWNPLAAGALARPGGPLDQIARERDATPAQITIAWLLQRSSTMLPIPGTSSVQHLEENALGATTKLSREEFEAIDRGSAP